MQFNFHANQSHSHKNGFALRLASKQRHKGTRKWSILCVTTVLAQPMTSSVTKIGIIGKLEYLWNKKKLSQRDKRHFLYFEKPFK